MDENLEAWRKKPSRLWYLLVIFLGPIGGIIGYFVLKDRDRKFAERLLIIGLIMIAVWWGASFLLSFLAYWYISGIFTTRTATILEVVDSYCSAGTATITLRNAGTETLPASKQTCAQLTGQCSGVCVPVNLEPGRTTTLTISGCASGTSHSWRISGPSNSVTTTVFCP